MLPDAAPRCWLAHPVRAHDNATPSDVNRAGLVYDDAARPRRSHWMAPRIFHGSNTPDACFPSHKRTNETDCEEHCRTTAMNRELQVDNVYLPVGHVRDRFYRSSRGMWLHYARGCSSVMWNTGRTFAATNRLVAAYKVARMSGTCDVHSSEHKSNATCSTECDHTCGIERILRAEAAARRRTVLMADSIAKALAMAERTPCPLHVPAWVRQLSGDGVLDQYIGARLHAHGYDSLQLLYQPSGSLNAKLIKWNTELWDVRSLATSQQLEDQTERSFVRSLRCGGRACIPTPSFRNCIGCVGCESGC